MIKTNLLSFLAIALLICSCKKTESEIGRDILPEGDLLNATYCDTSTIIAYNIIEDSIRTDESFTGTVPNLIGSMIDPVFGRTDASLFFNLTNPNNSTDLGFGADPKLDSIVLTIAYKKDNFYGDKTDPLLFNVYRLTESINYDSAYYSHSTIAHNTNEDITYSGTGKLIAIDPSSSVYEGDILYAPHMRIRLKNELGQQFLDDSTKLANTTALLEFFKGICVTTKNSTLVGNDFGCIGYFDLSSPLSKISIYYHNGTNFTTKKLDLTIRSSSSKFNQYIHDYTSASSLLTQQFPPTNTTSSGNTTLFLQGMASTRIKLKIPYIKNLSDSGRIAVNKAELIFKVDKSTGYYDITKYFVPGRVVLEGLRADGTQLSLGLDQYYDFTGLWGYYDAANYEYHFPIPYSAQRLANGLETDLDFTLRIFQQHTNPARVVIGGKDNTTYPLKLKLWYTRVE